MKIGGIYQFCGNMGINLYILWKQGEYVICIIGLRGWTPLSTTSLKYFLGRTKAPAGMTEIMRVTKQTLRMTISMIHV